MPNPGPLRGKLSNPPGAAALQRCTICHQELHFVRRHVSPPRLGPPVATEFYQCGACDAGYAVNVSTGTWKRWMTDDD